MRKLMQIVGVIGFLFFSLAIATGSNDMWIIPLLLGLGGIFLMWHSAHVIEWLDWAEEQERSKEDGKRESRDHERAI